MKKLFLIGCLLLSYASFAKSTFTVYEKGSHSLNEAMAEAQRSKESRVFHLDSVCVNNHRSISNAMRDCEEYMHILDIISNDNFVFSSSCNSAQSGCLGVVLRSSLIVIE